MADPLRDHEHVPAESRIEELLLAGLDHYFSGQHELAISVWTRVLFLDRSHARARAYIERARGAIAERQREGRRAAADRHRRVPARRCRRRAPAADVGGRARRPARRSAGDAGSAASGWRRRRQPVRGESAPRARIMRGSRATGASRPAPRHPRRDAVAACWPSAWPSGVLVMIAWSSGVLPVEPVAAPARLPAVEPGNAAARALRLRSLARARACLVRQRPASRRAHRARRDSARRSAAAAGRRIARPDPAAAARGSTRHTRRRNEMSQVPVHQLR